MTRLTLTSNSPASVKVDAVVIGVFEGPKGPVVAPGADAVVEALGGKQFPKTLQALGATGKAEQVTPLATLGTIPAKAVVAVGLGKVPTAPERVPHETLRRAVGAAVRSLAGTGKVALAVHDPESDDVETLRAIAEGGLLGAYAFLRYRSESAEAKAPVDELQLVVDKSVGKNKTVKDIVRRAEVVASAVALARDLVNTPPSDLHPEDFAAIAREQAKRVGLDVEVLDHKALAKGGYGGILGVGQGSANPPRLVHLSYRGAKKGPKVAFVGKGITFDSGGLSLKPAAAMEDMKSDMSGAAAVLAATLAAAELELPVSLETWIPLAENMPSGSATRPSDVLTMRGGKTVEVNNTDAEGRLILGDAMARACEDEPEYLFDLATLTGAQLVALGARTAGAMGNDDELREQVVAAANDAGEAVWPMPLPKDLRKGLDSDVADMKNSGPREGGMLTAGLFLQEFVADGVRWTHLDIAGPAFNGGQAYGYTPVGGTGFGVRTMVETLDALTRSAVQP